MTGLSTEARAAVLAEARRAGRAAGQDYRDHGVIPRPPGSLTEGGLIVRQYATAWHHGFDEGKATDLTAVTKVGPHGYIHGWIFVGIPGVGADVAHPEHGHGTVTGTDSTHATVSFDSGATHSFEHSSGGQGESPHLAPRRQSPAPAPKPMSNAEAEKWGNEHWPGPKQLPQKQSQALEDYSALTGFAINDYLRNGTVPKPNPNLRYKVDQKYLTAAIAQIDAAMRDHPTPTEAMVVHRGVGLDAFGDTTPDKLIGHDVHEPGYLSTSVGQGTVGDFSDHDVQMTINAPAGVPAFYMDKLSVVPGERELLLGRDLSYRITSATKQGGKWIVSADIVPTTPGASVTKVGPKGYIHGWIFVGVPSVGDSVRHPHRGEGTVTHVDGRHVEVAFHLGSSKTFEHTGSGTPKGFKERTTDPPFESTSETQTTWTSSGGHTVTVTGGTPAHHEQIHAALDHASAGVRSDLVAVKGGVHIHPKDKMYADYAVRTGEDLKPYAYWEPNDDSIHMTDALFGAYFRNEEAQNRELRWTVSTPDSAINRLFSHEYGHHLYRSLSMADQIRMSQDVPDDLGIDGSLVDLELKTPNVVAQFASKVSVYGATNADEAVAELWALHQGGSADAPGARVLGRAYGGDS